MSAAICDLLQAPRSKPFLLDNARSSNFSKAQTFATMDVHVNAKAVMLSTAPCPISCTRKGLYQHPWHQPQSRVVAQSRWNTLPNQPNQWRSTTSAPPAWSRSLIPESITFTDPNLLPFVPTVSNAVAIPGLNSCTAHTALSCSYPNVTAATWLKSRLSVDLLPRNSPVEAVCYAALGLIGTSS